MAVDWSFLERNTASRARLKALVARLADSDFRREADGGWTVRGLLAHLAFWDRRVVTTLDEWERNGFQATRPDPDAINEAELSRWLSTPGREAAAEVLAAAEAADRKIMSLDSILVEVVLANGRERVLDRAGHRAEHLEQIERVLAR